MKKIFNLKNLYIKILVIIFCIYIVSVLINQQTKLKSYKQSQAYYEEKTQDAKQYQESLKSLKENVDSPEYIEEIARVTSELGASLHNIIPLIPQNQMADIPAPDCEMIDRVRAESGKHLTVFRHCQHCRADSCGIPGSGKDLHSELYDHEVAETFSHG